MYVLCKCVKVGHSKKPRESKLVICVLFFVGVVGGISFVLGFVGRCVCKLVIIRVVHLFCKRVGLVVYLVFV